MNMSLEFNWLYGSRLKPEEEFQQPLHHYGSTPSLGVYQQSKCAHVSCRIDD